MARFPYACRNPRLFRNFPLHTTFTKLFEDRDAYSFFWGLVSFAFMASAHNNRAYSEFNWVRRIKWAAATEQISLPTPKIIVTRSATQVTSNATVEWSCDQAALEAARHPSVCHALGPYRGIDLAQR